MDQRTAGGGQLGRWRRHQHRRVVDVDRVPSVAQPVEDGPADQQQDETGSEEETHDRVEDPAAFEDLGVVDSRGLVDLAKRCEQRAIHVCPTQQRQHVVLVDRLALLVRQEGRSEAGSRIELDLAVPEAVVHVEQDHEAVVEALAADAPLVHQGDGVPLRRLGRVALGLELGVDDGLGTGPILDRPRDTLGLADRAWRQDLRRVVDPLAGDRRRVRWAGAGRGRRDDRDQQEERGSGNRCEPGRQGHARSSRVHANRVAANAQPRAAGEPRRRARVSRPSGSRMTWGGRGRPLYVDANEAP